MIKTFRGLLVDGGQDRIRLQTIKGKVGYRINAFQIMLNHPGTGGGTESVVKIFKEEQTTIDGLINFTDSSLLGAAYMSEQDAAGNDPGVIIVFDTEMFNQDIYITHSDVDGSHPMNYYFELEVIPLDDAGAEYTTLKDLRQN